MLRSARIKIISLVFLLSECAHRPHVGGFPSESDELSFRGWQPSGIAALYKVIHLNSGVVAQQKLRHVSAQGWSHTYGWIFHPSSDAVVL